MAHLYLRAWKAGTYFYGGRYLKVIIAKWHILFACYTHAYPTFR